MAISSSQQVVAKLWNYCNVLRDDGLSYQDDVEQLTFLLFLKMSHEQQELGRSSPVPKKYAWPTLVAKSGDELETPSGPPEAVSRLHRNGSFGSATAMPS